MSIAVQTAVWQRSVARGSALLVLLALADHADDKGWCWPSLRRIADMARVDVRTAQRALAELEAGGEIHIERTLGRSNRFLVLTPRQSDPRQSVTRDIAVRGRGDNVVGGGVTPLPPESSVNRQVNHQDQTAVADSACAAVARERMAKMNTSGAIRNPAAYLRTVAKQVAAEHHAAALAMATDNPDLTAEQIADRLEAQSATAGTVPFAQSQHPAVVAERRRALEAHADEPDLPRPA